MPGIHKKHVTWSIKNGAWYKLKTSKAGSVIRRRASNIPMEQPSRFPKMVMYKGKKLPGAACSAFGRLYQLSDSNSKNPYKYVLKIIQITDRDDMQMFIDEVETGSDRSASKWGTRIYSYTLFNPRIKSTQSLNDIHKDNQFPLTGMYIMEHVMKGVKPSVTNKFSTIDSFMKKRFKNRSQVDIQLMKHIRKTMIAFYKVPKIHGDLHWNNILVVYKVNSSKIVTVKRVIIIDYGSTHVFKGAMRKRFSSRNTLSTFFKKQHRTITQNPKHFRKTGEKWPKKSNIKLYRKKDGGQNIRHNLELLSHYQPVLMDDMLKYNKHPQKFGHMLSVSKSRHAGVTFYPNHTRESLKKNKSITRRVGCKKRVGKSRRGAPKTGRCLLTSDVVR